jgi:hypothetical protein
LRSGRVYVADSKSLKLYSFSRGALIGSAAAGSRLVCDAPALSQPAKDLGSKGDSATAAAQSRIVRNTRMMMRFMGAGRDFVS